MNSDFNPPISEVCKLDHQILFIGDIDSSKEECLEEFKIKAVISAIKDITIQHEGISYLCIKIDDNRFQQMQNYFEESYDFIENHIKETNVLVHCLVGMSRSASIIIYYLMRKNSWDYFQAYDFLKKQRKCIQPNRGFADQLEQYGLQFKK